MATAWTSRLIPERIRSNYYHMYHLLVLWTFLLTTIQSSTTTMALSAATKKPLATASSTASQAHNGGLVFHWFRGTDLRLHDLPSLVEAHRWSEQQQQQQQHPAIVIPLFCFDPRIFGSKATSEFGSLKCSRQRAQFVLESIQDLRQSLQKKYQLPLWVSCERPEVFLSKLLQALPKEYQTNHHHHHHHHHLIYQDEVCPEEQQVASKMNQLVSSHQAVWGGTLYHLDDLPYDTTTALANLPDTFTPFRNQVEKHRVIAKPLLPPQSFPKIPSSLLEESSGVWSHHAQYLPKTLQELGYDDDDDDESITNAADSSTTAPRGVLRFVGGETAALARVQDYIWTQDCLKTYFDTRNGMLGANYSSKLAPWLAHGNLSPRWVAQECQRYEQECVANKSTYWLVFELLWRDYFKFFALKHGKRLFYPSGTTHKTKTTWKDNDRYLHAWKTGTTGFPLVDANMRELAATGFMSNRGRQNVASFWAWELKQDWRYGADYFESTLLDYDVHSNWGNWCSAAGKTGGRINKFNIVKQSKDYDQHGDYVRHWLPELQKVPNEFVHEPWKMTQFQQLEADCRLGVDYPNPIVKPYYPNPKQGSRSKNDRRGGGGGKGKKNKDHQNSTNRGRGQRKDMKSLKVGTFHVDG